MQIHSVGIDLGKTIFHLVALSAAGKVLMREEVHSEAAHHFHREHAAVRLLLRRLPSTSGSFRVAARALHSTAWSTEAAGSDRQPRIPVSPE
jgi:predicted NBD/HSP70 family sugar kinase